MVDHDTDPDDSDSPSSDGRSTDEDGPVVVFEFTVPAEEFVFADSLRRFPDVTVEFERLVPTNHSALPYLWTTEGTTPAFGAALADDPDVTRAEKAATFEEGALYRLRWREDADGLLGWFRAPRDGATLLEARATDDEWLLKLRFDSRTDLSAFRNYCDADGIPLHVVRLYDLTQPKLGQYDLSEKQREALLCALELGHFEIPREATLEDVGDSLGISPRSVSERLRRGERNLLINTLTVGEPSAVGVGE